MSSPVQNGDKLGALELYAPPWVREQTPSSATFRPLPAALQVSPPPASAQADSTQSTLRPPEPPPTSWPAVSSSVQPVTEDSPTAASTDGATTPKKENDPNSAASLRQDIMEVPLIASEDQPASSVRRELSNVSGRSFNKPQPRMPKGVGVPNLDWRPSRPQMPPPASRSQPSPGEATVKALRHRLSLTPETLPEPAIPQRQWSIVPLLGRVGLLTVFAASVAYAITFYSIPETGVASLKPENGMQDQNTVGAADSSASDVSAAKQMKMRMVIEGRQAFANEPIPLGVSLIGTPNGEFALLSGLIAGTKLSMGRALSDTSWRLAARELSTAVAYAPRDYVGVMNAAIDLRNSNEAILDRNVMRLEWVGKQSELRSDVKRVDRNAAVQPGLAEQSIDNDEVEALLRRGAEYMKGGDIAAARLVLRRAASSRSPEAALALGETYDPYVYGELGVLGFAADPGQARFWYEQARKLGAREATQRIDRLAKLGR